MTSLKKLLARTDRTHYPTHGAPIKRPRAHLEALLAHREEREAEIVACLQRGASTVADIVARLYAEVDRRLHPAAARSVLAHLIKLKNEGRVSEDGPAQYALI